MNPLTFLAGLSNTVKAAVAGALLAVILALAIGLFITRHTLADRTKDLALCNAKQAVNLASIDTLAGKLGEQGQQIRELSDAGLAKQKAAQDALRAAEARDTASMATIDRLKVSGAVARAQTAPCVVSDTLEGARGL